MEGDPRTHLKVRTKPNCGIDVIKLNGKPIVEFTGNILAHVVEYYANKGTSQGKMVLYTNIMYTYRYTIEEGESGGGGRWILTSRSPMAFIPKTMQEKYDVEQFIKLSKDMKSFSREK